MPRSQTANRPTTRLGRDPKHRQPQYNIKVTATLKAQNKSEMQAIIIGSAVA